MAAAAVSCWLAPTAAAQECTNPSAACAPGGNFAIQFFHEGAGLCRFDARIDWNDGSIYNSPNFANGFIASHNYTQPGTTYNISVTGSGTPLQDEVICQFVPSSYKVEVPLPPPCDAQAQPPGCIFTIGLNDPVPPEVKDHFRELAQKLETANGQMGVLAGAACLPTKGLKGFPTQNRGLKIGLSFLSCGGLSGLGIGKGVAVADFYQDIADDPPDPNFTAIPQLSVPKVSKVKGKIKKKAAKRLTDVLRDQAELLGNAQAALRAIERAQGAGQAGNLDLQVRQTFAARNFALNLATAFRESAAARSGLGKAGGGIRLSKKTARALRKIARKTPARKFKGPDGNAARNALLKGPIRKVSFPKALSSKQLISTELEAAASLERWAAALFPSAGQVIVSRAHRAALPQP